MSDDTKIRQALITLLEAIVESRAFEDLEAGCNLQGPVVQAYRALGVDLPIEILEWFANE